ncbi:hypothetical protein ACLOJK_022081 [Asimina triloba]
MRCRHRCGSLWARHAHADLADMRNGGQLAARWCASRWQTSEAAGERGGGVFGPAAFGRGGLGKHRGGAWADDLRRSLGAAPTVSGPARSCGHDGRHDLLVRRLLEAWMLWK